MSGNYVIIGAGPAGLTAAVELTRRGQKPLVLEADRQVGGLSKTVERDGYRFDLGGHRFFTKNQQVQNLWREMLGDQLLRRPRMSRIYYRGKLFNYPLQIGNALKGLGPWTSANIILSFLRGKLLPIRPEVSFQDWVSNRFGKALFSIFFKTYTEKVWGIPCTDLSADWAAQRIRNLSLGKALLDALGLFGKKKIASLIDEFEYPRLGPGQMYEAFGDRAAAGGASFVLNTKATTVRLEARRVVAVDAVSTNGDSQSHDTSALISSMPLTELVLALRPEPPAEVLQAARSLSYRSFLTGNLILNQPNTIPDTWIYIHSPEVRAGRLQMFKNWSPDMVPDPNKSSVGLEYFANEGDELWTAPDDRLIDLAREDLGKTGLISPKAIEQGFVTRYAKAYPVYCGRYRESISLIRNYLQDIENLVCVGRYGQFRYNNMDHSIMTAFLGVRKLMGENVSPWSVNEEAEYHEGQ